MLTLDALTLDQLRAIATRLSSLACAGQVLADCGFVPEFDLSPGYGPRIALTGWQMPHASANVPAQAAEDNLQLDRIYPFLEEKKIRLPSGGFIFPCSIAPSVDSAAAAVTAAEGDARAVVTPEGMITAPSGAEFEGPSAVAANGNVPAQAAPIGDFDDIATPRRPGGMPPSPPALCEDSAAAAVTAADLASVDDAPPAALPPAAGDEAPAPEIARSIEPNPTFFAPPAPPPAGGVMVETAPGQTVVTPTGAADPAQDGAGVVVAAAPPPAAHPTAAKPAPWTDAEDQRLIDLVVSGLKHKMTRGAAMAAAAVALNRPVEGTKFRCAKNLKLRLAAAEAAAFPATTAPPGPPSGSIAAHLDTLPRLTHGRRWTPDEDRDLLKLYVAEMKLPEIAIEMGLDAGRLKHRLQVLTGPFTPAKVLLALDQRAAR